MNYLLKKILIVRILIITLLLSISSPSYSGIDPKVVALGTMAAYGTVGGMLLGIASLAFGTSGRAVSQGASLGLYAGLLFGGYVVGSHALKKRNIQMEKESDDYYPDTQKSPYESYFFQQKILKEQYAKNYQLQTDRNALHFDDIKASRNSFFRSKLERNYYLQLLTVQF